MDYDTIVVGAGIIGSATAYHLSKHGCKTLLLEQFSLPHCRGSSHGQSRITRKAYGKFEHFTEMMKEAYKLWEILEAESKTKLYKQTGMLAVGTSNNSFLKTTRNSMTKTGMHFKDLDPDMLSRKYPMLSFPPNYEGILDPEAGVLFAGKALAALQELFKKYGGVIHDVEPLLSVIPGEIITVVTTKRQYSAKNVVLTVGPWASEVLLPLGINLPLKPIKISVFYWREKRFGEHNDRKFPTFYEENGVDGKYHVFAMPSIEYPKHIKICLHSGPEIDPDRRDVGDESWVRSRMKDYVSRHFPAVEDEPSIVESCIYTNTPDTNFVLDYHPKWKNIIIGVGFSGHGFKLAPVVGKVLCQLAMNQSPAYDMKYHRIDRFVLKNKL